MVTFYGLIVSLIALTARPRLVVYGRTPEQMLKPLHDAALLIDPDATVDTETLQVYLPQRRIHIRPAGHKGIDSTSIESFEPILSPAFWDNLLGHLRETAESTRPPTPRRGGMMVLTALAMAAVVTYQAVSDRQQVVEGFREWLFR